MGALKFKICWRTLGHGLVGLGPGTGLINSKSSMIQQTTDKHNCNHTIPNTHSNHNSKREGERINSWIVYIHCKGMWWVTRPIYTSYRSTPPLPLTQAYYLNTSGKKKRRSTSGQCTSTSIPYVGLYHSNHYPFSQVNVLFYYVYVDTFPQYLHLTLGW